MRPGDTPAPFADAYQRLTDAQRDNSPETMAHRQALAQADETRNRRNSIKRRLPKPY